MDCRPFAMNCRGRDFKHWPHPEPGASASASTSGNPHVLLAGEGLIGFTSRDHKLDGGRFYMINVGLVGFGFAGRVFHAPIISAVAGLQLRAILQRSSSEAALCYPKAQIVRS